MPSDTTPSEYVSAKKLARPSLLDCRVYGFATVFVNKPLVTEHDPGVDVMRISEPSSYAAFISVRAPDAVEVASLMSPTPGYLASKNFWNDDIQHQSRQLPQ